MSSALKGFAVALKGHGFSRAVSREKMIRGFSRRRK
jgi:hypothetical protein